MQNLMVRDQIIEFHTGEGWTKLTNECSDANPIKKYSNFQNLRNQMKSVNLILA